MMSVLLLDFSVWAKHQDREALNNGIHSRPTPPTALP